MRHRVSGRSRPEVEYEPLIQLYGVVVVHASSHWQGRQVHLRTLRRLPSRILLRCVDDRTLPHSSSPQTSGSNRPAYGGGGASLLHFSGSHKGESLRVQVHSVGGSMEGMPG